MTDETISLLQMNHKPAMNPDKDAAGLRAAAATVAVDLNGRLSGIESENVRMRKLWE